MIRTVERRPLPIHAFCGQRHASVACPDGRVVCCICFDSFPVEALNTVGLDGQQMDRPEDVCSSCAEQDRTAVVVRWMATWRLNRLADTQTKEHDAR